MLANNYKNIDSYKDKNYQDKDNQKLSAINIYSFSNESTILNSTDMLISYFNQQKHNKELKTNDDFLRTISNDCNDQYRSLNKLIQTNILDSSDIKNIKGLYSTVINCKSNSSITIKNFVA